MNKRDILIAGGGLGGLTAAICLLEAGHRVRVFEQVPELSEIGAGIQTSANSSRVLLNLGLRDQLESVAVKPEFYRLQLYSSAEVLNEISLAEQHETTFGAPYYHIHRADLLGILLNKVNQLAPDAIHQGCRVTGYAETGDGVTLNLTGERNVSGDLLIGADGINSVVRAQMLGNAPATFAHQIAWRSTVPVERLPDGFMDLSCTIWCGPQSHMVVYYIRSGELINFVGCVDSDDWVDESWTQKADWEELRADFEGWHDDIVTLISAVDRDQCFRWALNNRPPRPDWSTERVTLMGDAIHPTIPYMAQGAAMAIEDAAVLTRALAESSILADALQLYQRNRYDRTTRVVHESSDNAELFHLGSEAALREAFSKRDLGGERGAWLFNYDPITVPLV